MIVFAGFGIDNLAYRIIRRRRIALELRWLFGLMLVFFSLLVRLLLVVYLLLFGNCGC